MLCWVCQALPHEAKLKSAQACPWVADASEGRQLHHTTRQMLEPQPLYIATWKTGQRARAGSVR